MQTKVIPFNGRHFSTQKHPPLTPKMMVALPAACDKQSQGKVYDPHDIKGSFSSLISRGLVERRLIEGEKEPRWQVTFEAIRMLRDLGIKVRC